MSGPVNGEHETLLAGMRNGQWLDAQHFAPLAWSVPGIVPEGFGLLVAPPKAGKSWLVAGIGLACASGGMALGRIPVRQRPVLYMALEDGHRRLQSRFRTLMGDGQPLPPIDLIIDATPKQVPGMIAEFLTRHQGSAAPLVILDTLGKVRPPKARGDDAYGTDYQLGGNLKRLVDSAPSSSLLVVHHTRKAESADFVDAVSGTQGIAGSADFVLVLNRARTSDQAVLSVTGRDVHEAEYALVFSAGCWSLDGKDLRDSAATVTNRRQTGRLGDRSTDALAFVQGRDETRAADLADHLQTTPDIAGRYLRRLHERGVIARTKSGVYVPATGAEGSRDGHTDTSARTPSTPPHHPEQVEVLEFGHSNTSDTPRSNNADRTGGVRRVRVSETTQNHSSNVSEGDTAKVSGFARASVTTPNSSDAASSAHNSNDRTTVSDSTTDSGTCRVTGCGQHLLFPGPEETLCPRRDAAHDAARTASVTDR